MGKSVIIDSHTHVGRLVLAGAGRSKADVLEIDYEKRVKIMDQNEIDKAVIMPTLTYNKSEGVESTRKLNDTVWKIAEKYDRFACPIATVEPSHGSLALEELERISAIGFKGIVWHHRFQGSSIDDPTTIECVKKFKELNLVGFIRCLPGSELENLWKIEKIADYTDQPLIILSALSSYENIENVIRFGKLYENLYFDTARLSPGGMVLERLVDELGAGRLVFGSDLWTRPLTYQYSANLFLIRKSDISKKEKKAILGRNIKKILDL